MILQPASRPTAMGSKAESPFLAVMSAFAGSGHAVHQANVREVPILLQCEKCRFCCKSPKWPGANFLL
jgi:hypothetical protein